MGRRAKGTEPAGPGALGLESRLRFPRVETVLEVAADRLSARKDALVPGPARRELHEADVLVTVAMAARVRCGLVEGPQAVAIPLSPHYSGHLPEGRRKRKARPLARPAVCTETLVRAPTNTGTRACSSTGSSPGRTPRSTGVQRLPAGAPSARGRTAAARSNPSGKGRGTARSVRSSSGATRTTPP
jgi:hypothetical protein